MKYKKGKMHKKGSVIDLAALAVFLFVIAVAIFVYWNIFEEWNRHQATGLKTDAAHQITEQGRQSLLVWDYLFPFLILGAGIGTAWLAFNLKSHPALFFASLLVLIFLIIIFGVVSDVFNQFYTDPSNANASATFSVITRSMDNLPSYLIILGFVVMIALYAFPGTKK